MEIDTPIGPRISQRSVISLFDGTPFSHTHETGAQQRQSRPRNGTSILVMACSSLTCDIHQSSSPLYQKTIGTEACFK